MDNQYYVTMPSGFDEKQFISPVFQNIAQQQANQNAALQQQLQNNQMAGQAHSGGMGGMNALAMAAMLRGKKPNYDQWQTTGSNEYFGANTSGKGAGLTQSLLDELGL